tara:strand:+ start:868 stop:1824 length:957 start_codon:yes stop_codon:yes gene_type:complete
MNKLPWIEKYRPKNLDMIKGQSVNIECIKKLLENRALPHLLFYGNSGTGKTSTIMSIINKLFGSNKIFSLMKLDASDDRGINSVREEIKGFAEKKKLFNRGIKIIILDEADNMTFDAQFALRRIIEKYSENTRFCLICNYENKIIPAIKSRCANFKFNPINSEIISDRLEYICLKENIKINKKAINIISELSNGDMRKAINLLQSVYLKDKTLKQKSVYQTAGVPSNVIIKKFIKILNKKCSLKNKVEECNFVIEQGYSLSIIIQKYYKYIYENKLFNENIHLFISDMSDLENNVAKTTFSEIYFVGFICIILKYNYY